MSVLLISICVMSMPSFPKGFQIRPRKSCQRLILRALPLS